VPGDQGAWIVIILSGSVLTGRTFAFRERLEQLGLDLLSRQDVADMLKDENAQLRSQLSEMRAQSESAAVLEGKNVSLARVVVSLRDENRTLEVFG
jgi:predicted nucleotidyltransferase